MSDLKITSLVSCILHFTKVCMKSLFIVIQESNIVIPYQVSMVHMFYLWHIHERTQRLFTGSTNPRRDVFSAGS